MLMLNRAFFSLQSNWIPTMVALGNLGLNAVLDFAFYRVGTWGIPLSTAVCNIVSTIALVWLLHRRLGGLDDGSIVNALWRIAFAGVFVAAVSYLVWKPLDDVVGRSLGGQILSLGTALFAAGLAYWAACRAFKVRELQALLSLRSRASRG
jgi:putative peptidoglycan lipid II flippase